MKNTLFWYQWIIRFCIYDFFYLAPKLIYFKILERFKGIEYTEEKVFNTVHKWANYSVKSGGSEITVNGLENVPKDRPVLFVPNHQSYGDVPLLIYALKNCNFGFVIKSTMLRIPFIGNYLRYMHCVSMDQSDLRSAAKSINMAIEEINTGHSLVIFPEGRRSFNNYPADFKSGAFRIVKKTGVTIVPIYLRNIHHMYEGLGCKVYPVKDVSINILPPIDTDNLSKDELKNLSDIVRQKLIDCAKTFE